MSKLDTKIINEKLEEVFNKLDSAAKINIALGFENSKWRFKVITNVTIFAALLKNITMGCPGSFLPEPLLRLTQVNYLFSNKDKEPYKEQLCLFRALAIYMNGHNDLDSHF